MIGFFLGAALVVNDVPNADKVEQLRAYFKPAPGEMVSIDAGAEDRSPKLDPGLLHGHIMVEPPKGQCLTITRHPEIPDDEICRPTSLYFRLMDIDEAGRIQWEVHTGKGDFGTQLTWPTPHRRVRYIATPDFLHLTPEREVFLYTKSCDANVTTRSTDIRVGLFGKRNWRISFPTEHEPVNGSESEPPNLYFQLSSSRVISVAEAAAMKKQAAEAGASMKILNRTDNLAVDPHKELKAKYYPPVTWRISDKAAYVINRPNIVTDRSMPPGHAGSCRYQFGGAPQDRESAWIECHEGDAYKAFLMHLPCLKRSKK